MNSPTLRIPVTAARLAQVYPPAPDEYDVLDDRINEHLARPALTEDFGSFVERERRHVAAIRSASPSVTAEMPAIQENDHETH